MFTIYAIDIRRKRKVRHLGIVHYAGSEQLSEYSMGAHAPIPSPHGARCGMKFEGEETPAYLGDDVAIVVTCVACLGDRRRG